jgi:hypothetical protein
MKEGCIIWDAIAKRPDIRYADGTFYGGLHCGDLLEVLVYNIWRPSRVEYCHSKDNWYLVGIENGVDILWLTVRN